MYRGKRRDQPQQPAPVEEEYDSVGEELVEEEVVTQEPVDAEVVLPRHVTEDNFKGRKDIMMLYSFTGTPEEFAQNKLRTEWRPASHMVRHFKHNMADVNRHIASDENLHGSLNRVVPLGCEMVAHRNSFPFDIGIDVDGMMPQVFSSHNAALWTCPADVPYTVVNQKVFEPSSFIDEHMMETMQVCTFDDLKEDIQTKSDSKRKAGYGTVAVGTLAHAQLVDSLHKGLYDKHVNEEDFVRIAESAESTRARVIDVPLPVAVALKKELEGPLRELEKRCMNWDNHVVRASRQDGRAHFNDPEGLHGELVGSDIDPTHKLANDRLNQTCNASFLVKWSIACLP
jgi:cytochrome b involved in lipid metabolism